MKQKQVLSILSFCVAGFIGPSSALPVLSYPIKINNSGFESTVLAENQWTSSIPGWTKLSGSAGVWDPTPQFYSAVPEGENVAWVVNGSISQVTSERLLGSQQYLLSVNVGRRSNIYQFNGYSIALFAGGQLLSEITGNNINQGQFIKAALTYNYMAGSNSGLSGQALEVRLTSFGSQVNFDNVSLQAIPEPSTSVLMLLGFILFGFAGHVRFKRKVKP